MVSGGHTQTAQVKLEKVLISTYVRIRPCVEVLAQLSPSEHVLMEFYMPWCPACKQFAPIYERVAQFFNRGISAPATAEPEGAEGPRPSPPVTVFSVDCEEQARPSFPTTFSSAIYEQASLSCDAASRQ